MKRKRALIVAGLVVCLVGVNIRGTFGLEENAAEAVEKQDMSTGAAVNTSGTSVTPDTPDTPDTPGTPDTPDTPDTPVTPDTPDTPDTPVTPDTPDTPDTSDTPNTPDTPDTPDTPVTPDTPDTPVTPDTPGTSEDNTNGGQNDNAGNSGNTVPPSQSTDSSSIRDEKPFYGNSSKVIWDNSKDAVYTGNVYNPSDLFVDNRDKVKYNIALPIEGIPSFITQEMIIGALKCQDETGFPASVTIAQIIQESGFGKYGPEGEKGQGLSYLAYQYNNLFGIKGTGPAGSVNMLTGEQTKAGESFTITAGFRVYNTYTESIEDRTKLLKEVYSDLIEQATDANSFAMRIGGRWATDIQYSQSLIKQMETYDLYRLDKMTLQEFSQMIGTFANPCPGSAVTSNFGWRDFTNSFHRGIDLGTGAYNIPTYAAEAGTVITAGWNDSAGNWIIIDHGNGLVTKYMHHDKMYVKEGQHVEKGQQIGLSGTTGNSTGNHLHFQVEENGAAVDPAPYLGLTE